MPEKVPTKMILLTDMALTVARGDEAVSYFAFPTGTVLEIPEDSAVDSMLNDGVAAIWVPPGTETTPPKPEVSAEG